MQIRGFNWDGANIDHIARHRVEPEEVEEAFLGKYLHFRSREGRYVLLGRSASGRYLCIAFIIHAGAVRVVTARDMSQAERGRYQRSLR